jgi:hypothetical protein
MPSARARTVVVGHQAALTRVLVVVVGAAAAPDQVIHRPGGYGGDPEHKCHPIKIII